MNLRIVLVYLDFVLFKDSEAGRLVSNGFHIFFQLIVLLSSTIITMTLILILDFALSLLLALDDIAAEKAANEVLPKFLPAT